MARAYLSVDSELRACFVGSQEDRSVRWVCGRIEGEVLKLHGSGKVLGSVSEDFDGLREAAGLTVDEPAFVVFARDEKGDEGPRRWMLVAWVPDTAAPRAKMLYSSSREDLKTSLGSGYFGGFKDYCANAESDLSWEMLLHFEETDHDNQPLTEQEILFNEEKKMEKDSSVRSTGMAVVPFHLSPEAEQALNDNFELLEIAIDKADDSVLGLGCAPTFKDTLKASVSTATEPRFLLAKKNNQVVFIYFCPEDASLKLKMTYSTAKATFADILRTKAIELLKSIEVRDKDDLDFEFDAAINGDNDTREITHVDVAKPQRPGRSGTTSKAKAKKKWTPDG